MFIAFIVLAPSAILLLLGVPFAKVAAASDRASKLSFRALMLRRLARRSADRRAQDRRVLAIHRVAEERRDSDRRVSQRRFDTTVADPPPPPGLAERLNTNQVLLEDPSGNPVELFQPTQREAAL
jgi:hypothetical protein